MNASIKREVSDLTRALRNQEWRGFVSKGSIFYKKEDLQLIIQNYCPTLCQLFGKVQVISAVRLTLMMEDVVIEPCKFTQDYVQYRGFRLIIG